VTHDELTIPTDTTLLSARLHLPDTPTGLVLVAHGAFACELAVAPLLASDNSGLAVVTAELSSGTSAALEADDRTRRDVMHVLGQRLATMTRWLRNFRITARLPIGYFGCGVGAGAACAAAVACSSMVSCLATWQGRIDLVGHDLLQRVRVPSLLLVSDRDLALLAATRMARIHLGSGHATKVLHGMSASARDDALLACATDYARPWLAKQLRDSALRRGTVQPSPMN
jgi:hypothetical protein